MQRKINPIKLFGEWTEGYALDSHVLSSNYLGDDEKGHPKYDTTRTELGQLLYEVKYQRDFSKIDEIIKLITPYLNQWGLKSKIDYIIPAPPSKYRRLQPVFELCQKIGELLGKPVIPELIKKNSRIEAKDLAADEKVNIEGSIIKNKSFKRDANVLVVDDLFQSGKTLNEITSVLRSDSKVKSIYVLTMTKTKGV